MGRGNERFDEGLEFKLDRHQMAVVMVVMTDEVARRVSSVAGGGTWRYEQVFAMIVTRLLVEVTKQMKSL